MTKATKGKENRTKTFHLKKSRIQCNNSLFHYLFIYSQSNSTLFPKKNIASTIYLFYSSYMLSCQIFQIIYLRRMIYEMLYFILNYYVPCRCRIFNTGIAEFSCNQYELTGIAIHPPETVRKWSPNLPFIHYYMKIVSEQFFCYENNKKPHYFNIEFEGVGFLYVWIHFLLVVLRFLRNF